MKKILALLLTLVLVFSMFSCGLFDKDKDGENGDNSNGENNSQNNNNNEGGSAIEGPIVDWEPDE